MGARLRGRTSTYAFKKGSEKGGSHSQIQRRSSHKALRRVLRRCLVVGGFLKEKWFSEGGFLEGEFPEGAWNGLLESMTP